MKDSCIVEHADTGEAGGATARCARNPVEPFRCAGVQDRVATGRCFRPGGDRAMTTVIKAQDRFDEPVTASVLAKATARGRQRRHPGLHALSVAYLPAYQSLLIGFADQSAVLLPVKNYPELSALGVAELEGLAIGYGGTALCLEARDLHVSIAGLVSASQPLMDLAATVIAVRNGSRRTEAKAQASRENGRKGGRPRKVEAA